MRPLLILAVLLLAEPAAAQSATETPRVQPAGSMSRCTYLLKSGPQSFVQRARDVEEWLSEVKSKAVPEWDLKAECHPADTSRRNWHLMVKSWGGTVSLIQDLTEDTCFRMLTDLRDSGSGTRTLVPGSVDTAECFL